MAEKADTAEEEVTKLRARVKRLEAERDKLKSDVDEDDDDRTGRRVADSFNDARRSKVDAATRVVRGVTLASVEFVRLFADSVSSFGDDVLRRNEGRARRGRTVRSLVRRLPEDLAEGFANAVDRLSDIPAKAADRYSKVYREGEDSDDDTSKHAAA
ncbi:MAG TPA: hypothetical protein VGC36_06835 [Rhizomicrobium sp.]